MRIILFHYDGFVGVAVTMMVYQSFCLVFVPEGLEASPMRRNVGSSTDFCVYFVAVSVCTFQKSSRAMLTCADLASCTGHSCVECTRTCRTPVHRHSISSGSMSPCSSIVHRYLEVVWWWISSQDHVSIRDVACGVDACGAGHRPPCWVSCAAKQLQASGI